MLVSYTRFIIEAIRRANDDNAVNRRLCTVVDTGLPQYKTLPWSALRVGNVIRLSEGELVPADIVALSAATRDGQVFVDCSPITGESRLVEKRTVRDTQDSVSAQSVCSLRGRIVCEKPGDSLTSFSGSLRLDAYPRVTPLDITSFIMRGSRIRETEWVHGVIIYSGPDTRIARNQANTRKARSYTCLQGYINRLVIAFIALTVTLSLLCSVAAVVTRQSLGPLNIFGSKYVGAHWYLVGLRFIELLALFVPIPLSAILDTANLIRGFQLERDRKMAGLGTSAKQGTISIGENASAEMPPSETLQLKAMSDLSLTFPRCRDTVTMEALGLVDFMFLDKTGTLTDPSALSFHCCSVGARLYGGRSAIPSTPSSTAVAGSATAATPEKEDPDHEGRKSKPTEKKESAQNQKFTVETIHRAAYDFSGEEGASADKIKFNPLPNLQRNQSTVTEATPPSLHELQRKRFVQNVSYNADPGALPQGWSFAPGESPIKQRQQVQPKNRQARNRHIAMEKKFDNCCSMADMSAVRAQYGGRGSATYAVLPLPPSLDVCDVGKNTDEFGESCLSQMSESECDSSSEATVSNPGAIFENPLLRTSTRLKSNGRLFVRSNRQRLKRGFMCTSSGLLLSSRRLRSDLPCADPQIYFEDGCIVLDENPTAESTSGDFASVVNLKQSRGTQLDSSGHSVNIPPNLRMLSNIGYSESNCFDNEGSLVPDFQSKTPGAERYEPALGPLLRRRLSYSTSGTQSPFDLTLQTYVRRARTSDRSLLHRNSGDARVCGVPRGIYPRDADGCPVVSVKAISAQSAAAPLEVSVVPVPISSGASKYEHRRSPQGLLRYQIKSHFSRRWCPAAARDVEHLNSRPGPGPLLFHEAAVLAASAPVKRRRRYPARTAFRPLSPALQERLTFDDARIFKDIARVDARGRRLGDLLRAMLLCNSAYPRLDLSAVLYHIKPGDKVLTSSAGSDVKQSGGLWHSPPFARLTEFPNHAATSGNQTQPNSLNRISSMESNQFRRTEAWDNALLNAIRYRCLNPEDACLIAAASAMGVSLVARSVTAATLEVEGRLVRFDILGATESTPSCPRTMVCVRQADSPTAVIYIKGSEAAVLPVCSRSKMPEEALDRMHKHLQRLSTQGLRILVLARKTVPAAQAEIYFGKSDSDGKDTRPAMPNRNLNVDKSKQFLNSSSSNASGLSPDLVDLFERDYELLSIIGLKEGILPTTVNAIRSLADSGIRGWIVTGDAPDAAVSAAFSSGLLNAKSHLFRATLRFRRNKGRREAVTLYERFKMDYAARRSEEPVALVVSGQDLQNFLSSFDLQTILFSMALLCDVVCCGRVLPRQKAQLIEALRNSITPEPIIMAVGDGYNDGAMLKASHAGIAVVRHGAHLVPFADVVIPTVGDLKRLLFVHGRLAYIRTCSLILWLCFKSALIMFPALLYSMFTAGRSTTHIYDPLLHITTEFVWLAVPALVHAVTEEDVPVEAVLGLPALYTLTRRRLYLNSSLILIHSIDGAILGGVMFAMYTWGSTVPLQGRPPLSPPDVGLELLAHSVVICLMRLVMRTHHIKLSLLATCLVFGILGFFGLLIYQTTAGENENQLFLRETFWLRLFLSCAGATLINLLLGQTRKLWRPNLAETVRVALVKRARSSIQFMGAPAASTGPAAEGAPVKEGITVVGDSVAQKKEAKKTEMNNNDHSVGDAETAAGEASSLQENANGIVAVPEASIPIVNPVSITLEKFLERFNPLNHRRIARRLPKPRRFRLLRAGPQVRRRFVLLPHVALIDRLSASSGTAAHATDYYVALPTPTAGAASRNPRETSKIQGNQGQEGKIDVQGGSPKKGYDGDVPSPANRRSFIDNNKKRTFSDPHGQFSDDQYAGDKELGNRERALATDLSDGTGAPFDLGDVLDDDNVENEHDDEDDDDDDLVSTVFGEADEQEGGANAPGARSVVKASDLIDMLTLRFRDQQLEADYQVHRKRDIRKYRGSYRGVILVLSVISIAVVMYDFLVLRTSTDFSYMDVILSLLPDSSFFFLFLASLYDFLFTERFDYVIGTFITVTAFSKLLADYVHEKDGATAAAIFCVLVFVVLRIPFLHAVVYNTIFTVLFTIRYMVSVMQLSEAPMNPVDGRIPGTESPLRRLFLGGVGPPDLSTMSIAQLLHYLPVLLGINAFTGFVGYRLEYNQRKGFLLDYQVEVSRRKQREILNTMLPPFIVDQMLLGASKLTTKDGIPRGIRAEDRGTVSVVFCDVYEFQQLVATLEPTRLVKVLDSLFLCFDKCTDQFGCVKIETVFETYLSAAGLRWGDQEGESTDPQQDAFDALDMSLAMLEIAKYITYETTPDADNPEPAEGDVSAPSSTVAKARRTIKRLRVKIGVHSGRVISGVVGAKKPQYALFGDTVNTASRMKTTGAPDLVHLSEATYKLVEADPSLVWEKKQIEVKGKGLMNTYLLVAVPGTDYAADTHLGSDPSAVSSAFRRAATGNRSFGGVLSSAGDPSMMMGPEDGEDHAENSRDVADVLRAVRLEARRNHRVQTGSPISAGRAAAAVATASSRTDGNAEPSQLLRDIIPDGFSPMAKFQAAEFFGSNDRHESRHRDTVETSGRYRNFTYEREHAKAPEEGRRKLLANIGGIEEDLEKEFTGLPAPMIQSPPELPEIAEDDMTKRQGGTSKGVRFSSEEPETMKPTKVPNAVQFADVPEVAPRPPRRRSWLFPRLFGSNVPQTPQNIPSEANKLPPTSQSMVSDNNTAKSSLTGNRSKASLASLFKKHGRGEKPGAGRLCPSIPMRWLFLTFKEQESEERYKKHFFNNSSNINTIEQALIIFLMAFVVQTLVFMVVPRHTSDGILQAKAAITWAVRSIFTAAAFFLWLLLHYRDRGEVSNIFGIRWMIFLLNLNFITAACTFMLANSWGYDYQTTTKPLWLYSDTLELFFYITILHHNSGLFFQHVVLVNALLLAVALTFIIVVAQDSIIAVEALIMIPIFILANVLSAYFKEYVDRLTFVVNEEMQATEDRGRELLHDMLPRQVLEEFQQDKLKLAYKHNRMTFLFADICGFTSWAKGVEAREVVSMLQQLFAKFDRDSTRFGLYKLCTIGDAYVAVSEPVTEDTIDYDPAAGAESALEMARAMIDNIRVVRERLRVRPFPKLSGFQPRTQAAAKMCVRNFIATYYRQIPQLKMRIGLHYGECVGGVIGSGRLRYDLWGIDVLTGNLMESSGLPDEICVSEAFKNFLEGTPYIGGRFKFVFHKEVTVINRVVKAYIISEIRSGDSASQSISNTPRLQSIAIQEQPVLTLFDNLTARTIGGNSTLA